MFKGHRNLSNGLYFADLNAQQTYLANKIDNLPNATTKSAITFLYLAVFSPEMSTLTQAIQKGFFKSWLGLSVDTIKKYVSNMPHLRAGRMDHVRKNIQSAKLQQVLHNILHDLQPTTLGTTSTHPHDNTWVQNKTNKIQNDQSHEKLY